MSLNATEQKLPSPNLVGLTIGNPCYKDFDVLVILSVAFGFEAPTMELYYEISLLSLSVSKRERLLSLGPILCRGLANSQLTSTGQKIQTSALFVTRVNASDMVIFSFLALSLSFKIHMLHPRHYQYHITHN